MKNRKIKFISILFLLIFTSLPIFAQEFVYVSVEKADLQNDTGALAEKISELLKAIKQEIAETYIYKQKYLVRLCDYQTDIDNIDRDPHDGYLDLPDKMFRQ